MLEHLYTPTHLFLMLPLIGLYLLPTLISIKRRHPQHFYIAIINIFFGSTGIGWVVALLWALKGQLVIEFRQPAAKQE